MLKWVTLPTTGGSGRLVGISSCDASRSQTIRSVDKTQNKLENVLTHVETVWISDKRFDF
jgi:hypothetical protein